MFPQVSKPEALEVSQRAAGHSTTVPVSPSLNASPSSTENTRLRLPRTTGPQTIRAVLTDLGGATFAVRLSDTTIGFVQQAGPMFVALVGNRLDLAEECGQFHSRDSAVAELVSGASLLGLKSAKPAGRFGMNRSPDRSDAQSPEAPPTAKAGDLLIFRPRARSRSASNSRRPIMTELNAAVILHGGREFYTTRARAESFLVWARTVAESGQAALVPLLHSDGVDLLLITGNTPVASSKHWS